MFASCALLLVGFFLRTWQLGAYDFWVDEGISYYVANRSPAEIIAYTASNIYEHPPGYYFGLHFWMQLAGTSEFAVRLLGAMGGTLYLALLIRIARRWFGARPAILAGALLSVQPLAVMLSRDARMYTWYGVAILLVVFLFDRATQRRRVVDWLLFALAVLFALALNYLSVFVFLALALFALIHWRTLGRSLIPFTLVLMVILGLPLLWILVSPGPRGSLAGLIDALRATWSPARLIPLYFGWPLSDAADHGRTLQLGLLAGLRWLLAVIGIVWLPLPRRWNRRMLQWLLVLLIVVPPLAASFPFQFLKHRYFFPTLGFFVLAQALGIVACWRRFRFAGAAVAATLVLALLLMDGRASFAQLNNRSQSFSAPMNYILVRARESEPIVYTFPWESFLDEYYDTRGLPAAFVPQEESPTTVEEAEDRGREILTAVGSAWLVLYPSHLKPEVVEQGFSRAGFAGEKTWFAGDRGVIRYFAERPVSEQVGGMVWADRVRLNRWWSSDPQVTAGDALRLEFEWQDLAEAASDLAAPDADHALRLIELSLVGQDGQLWATRVGAPCNGLCPLSGWEGAPVRERQALYVPADTPPGRYSVRLRRLARDGEPELVQMGEDPVRQAFADLLDIEVLPPADGTTVEASLSLPVDIQTTDSQLTLVSLTPPGAAVLPGRPLSVPMQWRSAGELGALEARLILTRAGQATLLSAPLGPAWYGSDQWTSGRLIRTQPSFTIPATLEPGEYSLALGLATSEMGENLLHVPLGTLVVRDRERRFDLPDIGAPVTVDWGEDIRLARVDAPTDAKAGETITVTLVWQASRPTGGNWKVFVHLVDEQGVVRGQGDAYPLSGAALTPTWQAGEVIVDPHRIELARDLVPGEYRLRIGFYNESTNERLPLEPGVDTYVWPLSIEIAQP